MLTKNNIKKKMTRMTALKMPILKIVMFKKVAQKILKLSQAVNFSSKKRLKISNKMLQRIMSIRTKHHLTHSRRVTLSLSQTSLVNQPLSNQRLMNRRLNHLFKMKTMRMKISNQFTSNQI